MHLIPVQPFYSHTPLHITSQVRCTAGFCRSARHARGVSLWPIRKPLNLGSVSPVSATLKSQLRRSEPKSSVIFEWEGRRESPECKLPLYCEAYLSAAPSEASQIILTTEDVFSWYANQPLRYTMKMFPFSFFPPTPPPAVVYGKRVSKTTSSSDVKKQSESRVLFLHQSAVCKNSGFARLFRFEVRTLKYECAKCMKHPAQDGFLSWICL